jgi:hypothetical protein
MTRTRTERLAEYQNASSTCAALQRVLLLGKDYAVRKSQVVGQYNVAGVTAAWPGLLAGEAVETSSATVTLENAVLPIFTENQPTPTIANGAIVAGDITRIWHNNGTTVWTGAGRTVTADVLVGDLVVLTNGATTFSTYVQGIEYNGTALAKVLLLDNSVPASLRSGYFNVTVAAVESHRVPAASLTLSGSQVIVSASLQLSSLRLGATAVVPATNYSGTVLSRIVVDYRATRTSSTAMTATQTVTSSAQLTSLFIGYQYPESELGFAVAQSLSPVGAYTIAPAVLCRAPTTYDDAGFTTAITAVTTDTAFSIICPMTQSATVRTATRNMLTTRAAVSGRRHTHAFFSMPVVPGVSRDSEVAAFIAAAAFNDENTVVVFPPQLEYSGTSVSDAVSTAIVAGLRNITASGLSIVDTHLGTAFTHGDEYTPYIRFLDQLAAGGVTCLRDATVVHARTTKLSANLSLEEGMVALKNNVRRRLFQAVEGLINTQRISAELLNTVRSLVRDASDDLAQQTYPIVGNPIWSITVGVPVVNGLVTTTVDIPITAYVSTTWFTGTLDVSISLVGE